MATCTAANGVLGVAVAGWAGRMSDRFGRRLVAVATALSQAAGMGVLALVAVLHLRWPYVVLGYGLTCGPFLFIASAFAYIADWVRAPIGSE